MPFTVLLCTDGSDLADAALVEGLAVVARPDRVVLATVVDAIDPTLVVGTGMAGGVMSPDTAYTLHEGLIDDARAQLDATRLALGWADAEPTVVVGSAGPALCDLAASLLADVIVMGSRGHGGLRRAVLGSVSDHVVRNAPCPVLIIGPRADGD